ncbi:MAG: exo-alpha-sialidase [Ruminococcaceae bacterium]|nr:exo-alpha-sialidase [Oscillospiraceae bacterium]
MKRIFSMLICLATLLTLVLSFSACKPDEEPEEQVGFDISGYTIVYPNRSDESLEKASLAIKKRIAESTGVTLDVKDDSAKVSEKEILVGNTDRPETAAARAKLDTTSNDKAYVIEVNAGKIVIVGKNADITVRALKYFATNFVSTSQREGTINIDASYSKGGLANTSTKIMPENLIEFSFGKQTTMYGDKISHQSGTFSYPKLIELQYQANAADNGILIATLNEGGSSYPILTSTDKGATWNRITNVSDTINEDNKIFGGRMPFLYEMPVDMGNFKKGDIILAGTSSDGNSGNVNLSSITLYVSKDVGKTWTTLYNIDYGGGQFYDGVQVDLGVWEPYLIYDNGRIYCFYSDDSDPDHDQKLVYKYTTDMENWVGKEGIKGPHGADGDPFEIVCCEDKDYRPGMISVVKMNNGEFYAVYDIVVYAPGRPNGKIEVDGVTYTHSPDLYKKSTSLDNWDIAHPGTVPQLPDGRYTGLSPWVTYSPTIGKTGMLVVYGRTWASTDKSQTDLFLSFDYGETYIGLENPFKYSVDPKDGMEAKDGSYTNQSGYSPSLSFSADGKTLYYATGIINKAKLGYSIEFIAIDIIY